MSIKKYRNAITFTDRNNTRIRVRQKGMSFSRTVNEDLTAYYELLDCIAIDMRGFFTAQKWLYYRDCVPTSDVYKYTPHSYARVIGWALEDGVFKGLDTKHGVNAEELAQEARGLSIAEAVWVYDRVMKGIKNGYQKAK